MYACSPLFPCRLLQACRSLLNCTRHGCMPAYQNAWLLIIDTLVLHTRGLGRRAGPVASSVCSQIFRNAGTSSFLKAVGVHTLRGLPCDPAWMHQPLSGWPGWKLAAVHEHPAVRYSMLTGAQASIRALERSAVCPVQLLPQCKRNMFQDSLSTLHSMLHSAQ